MLLEQLVAQAAQPPEFDWDSYYRWFFSRLACRDVTGFTFWQCRHCLTINIAYLPAHYGKCRGCDLLYLPDAG